MVGGGKDREEMSDLISRSELLKELESNKLQPTKDTDGFIDGWCEGFNTVVDMIRNQPTAFDTEKVVEQLLDMRLIRVEQCHGDYEIEVMTESNFDDAINIVKKGGVE